MAPVTLVLPPPEENAAQVFASVAGLRAALPPETPLIGFAGAPFTLFCYLVEGHGSKGFFVAKSFLFSEPAAADLLLDKLATQTIRYLTAQAAAGAQALMVFDSWAGLLGPDTYARYALPARRSRVESPKSALSSPRQSLQGPAPSGTLVSTCTPDSGGSTPTSATPRAASGVKLSSTER